MSGTSLPGIALGAHGAACGLLLLTGGLIWRDRRQSRIGRLSAALALGAAAASVNSIPGFGQAAIYWRAPVLALAAGNSAVFWLWARAAFDDDFVLRTRHAALWALLAGAELFSAYGPRLWPPLDPVGAMADHGVQVVSLMLAVAAAAQTIETWRGDLVMGRRRLRAAVLLGSALFTSVDALYSAGLVALVISPSMMDILRAAAQCGLAVPVAWCLLQVAPTNSVAAAMLPRARGDNAPSAPARPAPPAINPLLLRRLDHLMSQERVCREPGLTIGALAARLTVSDELLRRTINEGLGYRNFNTFINHYRLVEAKAALSDPSQREVPVLTIAMDAGFQSLGPFNRAFKADTGMTPSEYRRAAMQSPPAEAPSSPAGRKIG